jgi:hypothetical protein
MTLPHTNMTADMTFVAWYRFVRKICPTDLETTCGWIDRIYMHFHVLFIVLSAKKKNTQK